MARPPEPGLTAREAQIITVLWDRDAATVEEIRQALPELLTGSTLRTLLKIMAGKGYVDCRQEGRAKIYHPLVGRQEMQSSALRTLAHRLFQGSANLLLARLVEEEQVSLEDLDALRRKLRRRRAGDAP